MEGIGDAQYGIPPSNLDPRSTLEGLTQGVATIESDYTAWSKRARERAEFIAERQVRELAHFVEWLPTHPQLTDRQRARRAATIRAR
jgi:hypothetical protein